MSPSPLGAQLITTAGDGRNKIQHDQGSLHVLSLLSFFHPLCRPLGGHALPVQRASWSRMLWLAGPVQYSLMFQKPGISLSCSFPESPPQSHMDTTQTHAHTNV